MLLEIQLILSNKTSNKKYLTLDLELENLYIQFKKILVHIIIMDVILRKI